MDIKGNLRRQIPTCFKQIHRYKTYNSHWCLHAMTTKPKSSTLQSPVPSKLLLLHACCHKPCVLKKLHLRKGGRATPPLLSLSLVGWLVGWYLFSWKPLVSKHAKSRYFLSCFLPSNERLFSELFPYSIRLTSFGWDFSRSFNRPKDPKGRKCLSCAKNKSSKMEFLLAQVLMKIKTCWNRKTSFQKRRHPQTAESRFLCT